MRIREPRTTALIFSSGKMVCTGAKRYAEPLSKPSQTNNSVYKTGKDRIYVPKHLGGAKYFAEELHEMHFIA